LLFAVCCLLFAVCCLLFAVCCLLLAARKSASPMLTIAQVWCRGAFHNKLSAAFQI
jgi:hypothetical protein